MKRWYNQIIAVGVTFLSANVHAAPVWQNTSFASQAGQFTAQFDVTPTLANEDVVVGLSKSAASAYNDLAAAIRFGNNGLIDVRNGSSYSALSSISNVAGVKYHVRMVVDITAKKYSVYLTRQSQSEVMLAQNFSFRDSQTTVTNLANLAKYNASGDVALANFALGTQAPPPLSSPVWQNTPFAGQSGIFTAQFDAFPSLSTGDVVIGLSKSAAAAYTDFAAAVRFGNNGNGLIDVRNGANYQALASMSNIAGKSYRVRMLVDVPNKKYSVYITPQGQAEVLMAQNYAFRDSQSSVTSLANLAKYNATGDAPIANFSLISPAPAPAPVPAPAPTPTPVPSPQPSADCVNKVWQNLEACGWPGPGNTGWQHTGVTLKPSGSLTITAPGTVIDGLDVNGTIYVAASNVTIKRSRVRASAFALIQIKNGMQNVRVEDCELDGLGTGTNSMGVIGPATVLRSNIYNVENGITPMSNSVMQDNYIHDLKAAGAPHYDNIQIDGGMAHLLIRHNTIVLKQNQTSAVMIDDYFGSIDDILVDNNLMAGGGFTLYAYSESRPVTNVRHTNNKLSNALYPCVGYYGVWFVRGQPSDGWHRSGNVLLETGFNLDNGNPVVSGQLCN